MFIDQAVAKLRLFLADPAEKIWSDLELKKLLEEAVKKYSVDSCAFVGTFDVVPDENGNYIYPDDFIGLIIGWNQNHKEIMSVTSTELFEKQHFTSDHSGAAKYLYADLTRNGEYKLYPVPENNQNVTATVIDPFYGEVETDDFGVLDTPGYGTTFSITEYEFAGDCVYYRYAKIDEVQDYMALIYYAMYLAYSNMSELKNISKADFYLQNYKYRLDAFGKVKYKERSSANQAIYY